MTVITSTERFVMFLFQLLKKNGVNQSIFGFIRIFLSIAIYGRTSLYRFLKGVPHTGPFVSFEFNQD